MPETAAANNPPEPEWGTSLSRFRYLNYHCDVQRGGATGAPLSRRDAREFPSEVDIRRHGVRADRTVNLTQHVIFNECFHDNCLTSSDAKNLARVGPNS